jgi:hypothetical protein
MQVNLPVGGYLERRKHATAVRNQQHSSVVVGVDGVEKTRDTACHLQMVFGWGTLTQPFDIPKRRNDMFAHDSSRLARARKR